MQINDNKKETAKESFDLSILWQAKHTQKDPTVNAESMR